MATEEIMKSQVQFQDHAEPAVEKVRIRGSRGDLIIEVDDSVAFSKALKNLESELRKAPLFYKDSVARIGFGQTILNAKQKKSIREVCVKFGILYQELATDFREDQKKANALLISRTLRSGQKVQYDGHVVILGDVQPGAEVVASGHIIVWGTLRGVAHAGAGGNQKAFVCSMRLIPVQLRIANFVAVELGGSENQSKKPEIAHIEGDLIVAEEWDAKTFVKMGIVLE